MDPFWLLPLMHQKGCKLHMLKSNVLYFRLLKTGDLLRRVKRSKEATSSMSMLVSQEGEKVWGENREQGWHGCSDCGIQTQNQYWERSNLHAEVSKPGLQIWPGYACDAQPGAVPASRCSIIWFMIPASLKGGSTLNSRTWRTINPIENWTWGCWRRLRSGS